jgi:hypothetical protein
MPTTAHITITTMIHKAAQREWTNYSNTIKELRAQLLAAVPRELIEELANKDSDFNSVTPLAIMTKLIANHGKITPDKLKANLEKLEEPWNPTDNINVLWKRVKDCKEFAVKGKEPIAESTIVRTITDNFLIFDTFKFAMDIWLTKTDEEQSSYEGLKKHFTDAYKVHAKKSTSKSAGYAGSATKTVTPEPTPTKTKKVAFIAKTTPSKEKQTEKTEADKLTAVLQYCWSHGNNWSHCGNKCTKKKEGHIDTATITNMQGGRNNIWRNKEELKQIQKAQKNKKRKTEATTEE